MGALSADRHLLFGLLALQNGLIDQVQLVAAFQAWTRDKPKALADHLVTRGDLDPDDRVAIDALVDRHLKKNGGDVEKSLAAVPAGPSTRERLAQLADPVLDATLSHVGSIPTEADSDRTGVYHVGVTTSDGQRFRVLRPHAKGGLGAVFVALDSELNREVAIKQILDDHADDPISRQRFLLEAEITGGLEHPGIVPVYGLGAYGDGRPYYAMRFIRGDSLKEAIEKFHGRGSHSGTPSSGRSDRRPDEGASRDLELRRLLRRFLDVCNAIEYAHSRGVLHRDLKPGNVIVGKHGETLVVDWGLAKALGHSEPTSFAEERTLRPSSASGSTDTLPGQAMGTPAYMSPEQARGDLEALGARSDVYSLGATLYCLLTGKAPFEGNVVDVLRAVESGDFRPPRALDPSIEKALEAICLKAMATKPEDRYASCRALAEDIERWTADESVSAYPREPWNEHLSRWFRGHRGFAQAGAAALVLIAVTAVVSAFQIDASRRDAEAARREAIINEGIATNNYETAKRNLRLAQDVVRDSFHKIASSSLAQVPQGGPLRRQLAKVALDYNDRFLKIDPENRDVRWDVADINRTMGNLFANSNQPETAMLHFNRSLELNRGLARDLPANTGADFGGTAYGTMLGKVYHYTSTMLRNRGRHAEALRFIKEGREAVAEARRNRERTLRSNPELEQLSKTNQTLAKTSRGYLQEMERVDALLESEEARIDLEEGRPAQALASYDRLVAFFRPLGEALDAQAARAAIRDEPGGTYRQDLMYLGWVLRGRGSALHALGHDAEAREPLDEAVRRLEGIENVEIQAPLCEVLLVRAGATSDPTARRADIDRVVKLVERLAGDNPEISSNQSLLARALIERGNLQAQAGKSGPAAEDFRSALSHVEPLLKTLEGKPAVDDLAIAAAALAGLGRGAIARGDAEGRLLLEKAAARLDEALVICPKHSRCLSARDRLRE